MYNIVVTKKIDDKLFVIVKFIDRRRAAFMEFEEQAKYYCENCKLSGSNNNYYVENEKYRVELSKI